MSVQPSRMDMRKLVGRNVRRIRLEKGLTQEKFAEQSGFTQQYMSGLERGRRNPTIVSLYEIALALGVEHLALVNPDNEAREEEERRLEGKARRRAQSRVRRREPKSPKKTTKSRGKPRAKAQ
jgi:transcriptional regulator with XRE-family HTH domain